MWSRSGCSGPRPGSAWQAQSRAAVALGRSQRQEGGHTVTCHWETLPTHAHPQGFSHICVCTHAHTRTHSHTITTNVTWIVLFNSHDNSRSQRTILNFQLLENEAEAWRGGVSSEGWIPTRADWLRDPHAPNQGTGGQPTCDGHHEPDAVRATATQLRSRWTQSPPRGASSGHSPTRQALGTQHPRITLTISGHTH